MSTETLSKPAKPRTPRLGLGRSVLIAVIVTAVLTVAVATIGIAAAEAGTAGKRAAFEKVLNMSSSDLESKTVSELNGYRQDILRAGNYSLVLGNVSGYDKAIVERELHQVEDLIATKTNR